MLEQVNLKIQELKAEKDSEYAKRKEQDLLDWGITKKPKKGEVPVVVTDEEYEELKKAASVVKGTTRNSMSMLLNICSVVLCALGFIVGIVAWVMIENLGFIWFSGFALGGIILSVMLRGLGESINLTQKLIDIEQSKAEKKEVQAPAQPFAQNVAQPQVDNSDLSSF